MQISIRTLDLLAALAGYPILVCLLLAPVGYVLVGYKFDKLFKRVTINPLDPNIPILSHYTRTLGYMVLIAYPKRYKKNKLYQQSYGGYDFYKNASYLQRVFSIFYFNIMLFAILSSFIFVVFHYFRN